MSVEKRECKHFIKVACNECILAFAEEVRKEERERCAELALAGGSPATWSRDKALAEQIRSAGAPPQGEEAVPDPVLSCGHRISAHPVVNDMLKCPTASPPQGAPTAPQEPLREALRFFACVIKSREVWTAACQQIYDHALAAAPSAQPQETPSEVAALREALAKAEARAEAWRKAAGDMLEADMNRADKERLRGLLKKTEMLTRDAAASGRHLQPTGDDLALRIGAAPSAQPSGPTLHRSACGCVVDDYGQHIRRCAEHEFPIPAPPPTPQASETPGEGCGCGTVIVRRVDYTALRAEVATLSAGVEHALAEAGVCTLRSDGGKIEYRCAEDGCERDSVTGAHAEGCIWGGLATLVGGAR